MKALTVCQGWASLIFHEEFPKDVENRTWSTSHRGDLLIHAGRSQKQITESRELCSRLKIRHPRDLVYGAIIGIVEIEDCRTDSKSPWAESGSQHWILKNPRLFERPIPCNGALSLWTPSNEVLKKIGAAGLVTLHRSVPGRNDRLLQPQVLEMGGFDIVAQLSLF